MLETDSLAAGRVFELLNHASISVDISTYHKSACQRLKSVCWKRQLSKHLVLGRCWADAGPMLVDNGPMSLLHQLFAEIRRGCYRTRGSPSACKPNALQFTKITKTSPSVSSLNSLKQKLTQFECIGLSNVIVGIYTYASVCACARACVCVHY